MHVGYPTAVWSIALGCIPFLHGQTTSNEGDSVRDCKLAAAAQQYRRRRTFQKTSIQALVVVVRLLLAVAVLCTATDTLGKELVPQFQIRVTSWNTRVESIWSSTVARRSSPSTFRNSVPE
jgi:hypothetical protein